VKVCILTEGGVKGGFGHITRCTSIYQALQERGIQPTFIINGDESVQQQFKDSNVSCINFDWQNDIERLFTYVKGADIVFIDSYLADYNVYEKVSKAVKTATYFDDDIRMEYPRGFVINGAILAERMPYPAKEDVTYLLGTKYTPLRKEFWDVPVRKTRDNVEVIMITFGGADIRDLTPKVLKLLVDTYPGLVKKVIIGKGFRNAAEIEALKDNHTELIYYPDTAEMKKFMLESDIAISAGGQTLYELARMGVPAIVVAVADNQLGNIEGFQRLGLIDYAGYWDECDLLDRILGGVESLKDRKRRFCMRTNAKKIIDGRGSLRIRDTLLNTEKEGNPGKRKKGDSQLMKKAVSSENLIKRSATNQQYAENDFNLWTKTLLSKLSFSSVLDVCCGTGNQLVIYSAIPAVSRIVGIDISKEAVSKAGERLRDGVEKGRVVLKAAKMEEVFSKSDLADERFGLISCFYGLYYSQNPVRTLREMIMHLSSNGTILIVGPYGKNNAAFFTLLQRHFSLPDLVIRSSTSFMEEEVYPVLIENCDVTKEQFINRIHYPSAELLIDYWKASTFYFPEHEKNVKKDIEAYFSSHEEFIVEKHIMAYIARRRS